MKFKIISGDVKDLQTQINRALKDGWTLHGTPFVSGETEIEDESAPLGIGGVETIFSQAMVKAKEEKIQIMTFEEVVADEYVQKGYGRCPYPDCKSEDVEGGFISIDLNGAQQTCRCLACGRTWSDFYTLTGVSFDDPLMEKKEDATCYGAPMG